MTTAPRSFDERNIDGDNNDDKDQDKFDEHRDNNKFNKWGKIKINRRSSHSIDSKLDDNTDNSNS